MVEQRHGSSSEPMIYLGAVKSLLCAQMRRTHGIARIWHRSLDYAARSTPAPTQLWLLIGHTNYDRRIGNGLVISLTVTVWPLRY